MEDNQQPLALPAPSENSEHTHDEARNEILAVQPTTHNAPTTLPVATPHGDLAALIESIPAPIHIENAQFTIQQNATFHIGQDLASIQAKLGQTDHTMAHLLHYIEE
jgi:hypothetical protein